MDIEISKDYNLRRLQKWLDLELSTSVLILLSFFANITLILAAIAAVTFTPFMIKILFDERRFGWIIFFVILVLIPLIYTFLISNNDSLNYIFQLISLALFYFYCFILRLAIKDW